MIIREIKKERVYINFETKGKAWKKPVGMNNDNEEAVNLTNINNKIITFLLYLFFFLLYIFKYLPLECFSYAH